MTAATVGKNVRSKYTCNSALSHLVFCNYFISFTLWEKYSTRYWFERHWSIDKEWFIFMCPRCCRNLKISKVRSRCRFTEYRKGTKMSRATFAWPWKSVRNLFHGPMFGKIKPKLLLLSTKETTNMGSKQFYCPITSRDDVVFHPSSLSQWKFALVCLCSISQLNVLHFCLSAVFTFFLRSHESRSITFAVRLFFPHL